MIIRTLCLICGLLVPGIALAATAHPPSELQPLLAYIDPASGSILVQALIAAVAGLAVTSRIYWQKIKVFLGMASESDDDLESPRDDE